MLLSWLLRPKLWLEIHLKSKLARKEKRIDSCGMKFFQNSYLSIGYSIHLYDTKYCHMIAFMLFHALIERSISAGATCQLILKYLLALLYDCFYVISCFN